MNALARTHALAGAARDDMRAGAVDRARNRRGDRRHRQRRFQVSGVEMDSRDVRPGDLFLALKGEAMDGHRFSTRPLPRARPPRSWTARSTSRTSWSRDTMRARGAGRRSARTGQGEDHRRDRFGRQDRRKGGDLRRARSRQRRRRASFGPQLQQPCRRAAQPVAHARAHALRRVRNGHEPCGEIADADRAGAPACRGYHHDRARAYRKSWQRRGDCRRQGGDLRRAGSRRHRRHPRRQPAFRTAARRGRSAAAQGRVFGRADHADLRLLDAIPSANGGSLVTADLGDAACAIRSPNRANTGSPIRCA